jgi:hypothetical protein
MKKYILIFALLLPTIFYFTPDIFAQTTDLNQKASCNNKRNGDACTYQEILGGGRTQTTSISKDGFCDRSNGGGDANSNPLTCKSGNDANGWEICTISGDACKDGNQLGVCGTRGPRGISCDTTEKPPSNPGEINPNTNTPSTESSVSTSFSPTTTAGTVSYESYTNFPGVGRISDLCQLITALWYLGFAVLLTSVLGMFLWGGYIYVTAGVNAGKVNQAKEIFTNTITGLIIGLSIFIIINIINPGLLQGNCSIPPIGSTGTGPVQPTLGGPGTSVPGNRNCDGCVSLRSQGVTVANWNGTNGPGRTDKVLPQVATATKKVQDEMASSGTPIHITAAWSNGVGHSSGSQHYQGLAVDIQSVSGGSRNNATLQQIANACRKAGFTFVLVESYHTHCDMR